MRFLALLGEDPPDSFDVGFLVRHAEWIEPSFETYLGAVDRLDLLC